MSSHERLRGQNGYVTGQRGPIYNVYEPQAEDNGDDGVFPIDISL